MPQVAPRVLNRFQNSENRITGRFAEAAMAKAMAMAMAMAMATSNATLRTPGSARRPPAG